MILITAKGDKSKIFATNQRCRTTSNSKTRQLGEASAKRRTISETRELQLSKSKTMRPWRLRLLASARLRQRCWQPAPTMIVMMIPFSAKRKRARVARKTNNRKTIEGRNRGRREEKIKQLNRATKRKKKASHRRPLAIARTLPHRTIKRRRRREPSPTMSKKRAKAQTLLLATHLRSSIVPVS